MIPPAMELDLNWVLSGLLFIPYLVWGVFTLHYRYQQQHELKPLIEALTLLGVAVFFLIQWQLLSDWLAGSPGAFFLALMALIASGLALYGHLILDISSQALVNVVMPAQTIAVHEPQYGPGEARELVGDFEGAVVEYKAVARMFPKDSTAAVRVADNLSKLGEYGDAIEWMEKGFVLLKTPQHALPVANRLCDIYTRHLNRPGDARRILESYVKRFPEGEYTPSVRLRIERMRGHSQIPE